MTDEAKDATKKLTDRLRDVEARRALEGAGGPVDALLPLVRAQLTVTDSGDVRTADGRTPEALVEAMAESDDFAPVFGRQPSASFEGKPWAEMTMDEKVQYTEENYG